MNLYNLVVKFVEFLTEMNKFWKIFSNLEIFKISIFSGVAMIIEYIL